MADDVTAHAFARPEMVRPVLETDSVRAARSKEIERHPEAA